jgi:hypothetical protein
MFFCSVHSEAKCALNKHKYLFRLATSTTYGGDNYVASLGAIPIYNCGLQILQKKKITFHPSEAREGGRSREITFSSLIFISFISSGSLSIAMLLPPPRFFMLVVGAILTEAIKALN